MPQKDKTPKKKCTNEYTQNRERVLEHSGVRGRPDDRQIQSDKHPNVPAPPDSLPCKPAPEHLPPDKNNSTLHKGFAAQSRTVRLTGNICWPEPGTDRLVWRKSTATTAVHHHHPPPLIAPPAILCAGAVVSLHVIQMISVSNLGVWLLFVLNLFSTIDGDACSCSKADPGCVWQGVYKWVSHIKSD